MNRTESRNAHNTDSHAVNAGRLTESVNKKIKAFDDWIINKPDDDACISFPASPDQLSFGQLNDLLLYRHHPDFIEQAKLRYGPPADNHFILRYTQLSDKPLFKRFNVNDFIRILQKRIRQLPDITQFKYAEVAHLKAMQQNLVVLAFSAERWSQQVLSNPPGTAVKKLITFTADYSLHQYLSDALGNYNTLAQFALASVSSVQAIYHPHWTGQSFVPDVTTHYPSFYDGYDRIHQRHGQRFPSTMDLSAFPTLIKKGELISYVYNEKLLTLNESVTKNGLANARSLGLCREITLLFKLATYLYTEFHRDPLFNDSKFIHVLRQYTIALDKSPGAILLDRIELSPAVRAEALGFIDHYLVRRRLEVRERELFVTQILLNEGMPEQDVSTCVEKWFTDAMNLSDADFEFHSKANAGVSRAILKSVCEELVREDKLGLARLRYTLALLQLNKPHISKALPIPKTELCLNNMLAAIHRSTYQLVPSGANSVAYFGPDAVLGAARHIPNYLIHMVNRLTVMTDDDAIRFWRLQNSKNQTMLNKIQQLVSQAERQVALPETAIEQQLLTMPFLADYVDLFEAFAQLGRSHNGTINRYVRNVDKKMSQKDKAALVSSPAHGTTYILPDQIKGAESQSSLLPTLDLFSTIRSQHTLLGYVKPLAHLRKQGRLSASEVCYQDMKYYDTQLFAADSK